MPTPDSPPAPEATAVAPAVVEASESVAHDASAGLPRKRRADAHVLRRARRLRALRIPLLVLMFLALAAALIAARSLVIPLVLAAFVGMGLNPVVAALSRAYVPRALGALAVLAILLAALAWGISLLATPAQEWIRQAPQAIHELAPKIRHMFRPLSAAGHAASQSLIGIGVDAGPQAGTTGVPGFSLADLLLLTPRVLAGALTVVLLVFFFLAYGDDMRRRLVNASPRFGYRRSALNLVRGIQQEISRYLLTTSLINVSLGAVTAGILWYWKLPDPVLWGCAVALLNFMPYVGAISATLILAAIGLLHFDSPGHALLPALCFAVVAAIEGNLVTPLVMGRRLRLSPLAILVWLLVWGWMWGVPGALLAVPMLTCAKLIAERVPGWQWFAHMVER